MTIDDIVHEEPFRTVGPLLGFGIFVAPFIFVWALLRDGHSMRARIFGFGYLALLVAVGLFS